VPAKGIPEASRPSQNALTVVDVVNPEKRARRLLVAKAIPPGSGGGCPRFGRETAVTLRRAPEAEALSKTEAGSTSEDRKRSEAGLKRRTVTARLELKWIR
jgi:hypothetical protein